LLLLYINGNIVQRLCFSIKYIDVIGAVVRGLSVAAQAAAAEKKTGKGSSSQCDGLSLVIYQISQSLTKEEFNRA